MTPRLLDAPFAYAPPRAPYLSVIHRDRDLLVLSKPSGLLSSPGKDPALADCLEARAQAVFPQALRVHRLDHPTSGVLVMALNRRAQRLLGWQFERRLARKRYVARVGGRLPGEAGRVDAPLMTDWPNRPLQKIDPAGREAVTDWAVIAEEDGATRVALTPLTGRSHQLRVHMASLGAPILGDPFYGCAEARAAAPRLHLHAETLTLRHPADGREVTFRDPCPF
ncbi:MAG: RNA pseudouridine synthase [Rhodobacteraceae bacterium]|nr:MAG: RNA pseudouridine synthase [Paracoccaceae bacterium]